MKPGFTVNDLTPSAIGCLIESFHSSGKVPILNKLESIKEMRKKIMNEGIIDYLLLNNSPISLAVSLLNKEIKNSKT